MNLFSRTFGAFAFGAAALLAACGDSTGEGTGQLNIQLTDAPFPFAEVSRVDVFVVRIDAKTATTDSAEAAREGDSSGWVTLASPNASFNLLDLQGGKTANLGTATLTTGTYRGFRLVLDTDKSTVTLKDGSKPAIKWPSAGRTGIKINLDAPVSVTKDSSVMVLDFDVGRSFVLRGNSISQNGLLFKPVIRATARESTGGLTGSVRADNATGAAVAGASVEILKAGTVLTDTVSANVIRTTSTDAAGAFRFSFLLPGSYTLRATPAVASGYKPALLATAVTVTSGSALAAPVIVVTK